MTDPKAGPLVTLVLALADEYTNQLQVARAQFIEDGEHEAAKDAAHRLEHIGMLQLLVKMMVTETAEQTTAPTPVEAITTYLQEHDADVFPINLRELAGGKLLLLDTAIGINAEVGQWLDTNYPNVILSKAPRSSTPESNPLL